MIGHAATAPHGQGRSCVITRRATFSSSHLYSLPELSAAENQQRFGPCAQAPGHGHNYELIVSMAAMERVLMAEQLITTVL